MSVQTLNINGREVKFNTGLFIGSEFVKPQVDKTFPVEDPRIGKTIIEVSEGSVDDVDIAVKAARKKTNDPAWNELNPAARGQFLLKLADLMEKHFDDILAIEMLDTGKTKKQAANLDLPGSIDKVVFTGSTVTGRAILRAAADSNLKKVTLELGGKSPNIILPDADLEKAVKWSAWGINMNYGQTCHAGTRIHVHEDIYDKFTELFTARMKEEEGATVTLGGKAHEAPGGGYFIQPTIFTNVTPEMKIVKEEIFGPVVTVITFKTEEDVLELANNTTYGLAAEIHTNDYQLAIRVTNKLKAGTAWVNMFNLVHWSIPFGGYKESGTGRECGEAALENYTQTKAVFFNMGVDAPQ
ncbi:ALDH-like protein [Didymella exigua CBS 183.55]|uniref:aldehyde dehydrogenase (NAD(+)) n=1 Tax=Didymella exigua CBS 183.55 TaxID=1150837 RepID=A0A6A5RFB6_9PLEO|nr:ALDH-like protein [Didymella exigua CBS 183.55]KAF1925990.1 ALDH-like protein [Didymella exigua CBS 183.55]